MRKAYIIENYSITDKQNYIPPVKTINEALEKHKGKFLVATPKAEILSGKPKEVTIVLEFNSVNSAKNFYESEDYKQFKNLYENTTEGWINLAEEYTKK
jgi:uncharacterized protein (DUF1330 family)